MTGDAREVEREESEKSAKPGRVMVDIETLGTEPGSVILSIGAVTFGDVENHETWHASVDLESAVEYGLSVDGETLAWWLEQDNSDAVLKGGCPLDDTLREFAAFVDGADEIWANSPSFDLRILDAAFDAVGIKTPWEFWQERDFRTLKNLPGRPDLENTDEHNALGDAYHQAEVAEIMLEKYDMEIQS